MVFAGFITITTNYHAFVSSLSRKFVPRVPTAGRFSMSDRDEVIALRNQLMLLEDRIEFVLRENDALHRRLDAVIEHAQVLESELRDWEAQGPAPSLVAASQVYQSRITRLEDELRQLLEAGGEP